MFVFTFSIKIMQLNLKPLITFIYFKKRIIYLILKMKRQFSFINNQSRHLRLDSDSFDHPTDYNHKSGKSYKYSHKSNIRDSENSVQDVSWTDLRVQEIKRKYDTPSYRNQSQRADSFQRHNRIKTEFDYPSESKKNLQPHERFSSIRRETNKADYLYKKQGELSKENSFTTKVQNKFQVRAFNERAPLSEQSQNYINEKKSNRKQEKQTHRRREENYKNHAKRQGIQQNKQNKEKLEDDQVLVFKKIQQMKQSILNQKRKANAAPSNIQSRNTYHRSSLESKQYKPLKDYTNNQAIDPRVNNIDKINSKIKHILDCLHDNQCIAQNKSVFEQKKIYQNRSTQTQIQRRDQARNQNRIQRPKQNQNCFSLFYRDSISKDISCKQSLHDLKFSNNFQETKILERQQIRYAADQNKNSRSQLEQNNNKRRNIVLDSSKIFKRSQYLEEGQQLNEKSDNRWRQQFIKGDDKKMNQKLNQQNQYRDINHSRSFLATGFEKKQAKQPYQYNNHRNKISTQRQASEDQKLNSGSKLDDQISRIQKRIKLFEQEKRKLQIDFKPFQYIKNTRNSRSSSNFLKAAPVKDNRAEISIAKSIDSQTTSNLNQLSSRRKVSDFRSSFDQIIQKYQKRNKTQQSQDFEFKGRHIEKGIEPRLSSKKLVIQRQPNQQQMKQLQNVRKAKQFEEKRRKQQFEQRRRQKQLQERRQKQLQEKRLRQQFEERKRQIQFEEKRAHSQLEQKRQRQQLQKAQQIQQELQMKRRQQQQISLKAGQGIQQRRRKLANLNDQDNLITTETKKLVERLSKQVQIDQQLRNAKIWMDYLESMRPKDKIQKLKQILKEKNINMSQQEMDSEFLVTEEENNPFYSHRQGSNNFETIIEKYIQSNKYWTQNINHVLSLELLKRQKLIEKLDLEKKGFVILGDLVRFLNIESGRFYRNRDIILIWRRIASKGQGIKISFDKFLSEITQKK